MSLARAAASLILVGLLGGAAAGQEAAREDVASRPAELASADGDLAAPLRTTLQISDAQGQVVQEPAPGSWLRLTLDVDDAVTRGPGRLPATRSVMTALDDEPLDCARRAFLLRNAGGRRGDQALQGAFYLLADAAGRLALVDPALPASRNAVALKPSGLARPRLARDGRGLFYAQDGADGAIVRIETPDLAVTPLAEAGRGVLHVDDEGALVVGRDVIGSLGAGASVAAPVGAWRLERSGAATVLRDHDGRRLVLPDRRALEPVVFAAPAPASALDALADASLLALKQDEEILLLAAGGRATRLRLGFVASQGRFTPDGRHLVALDADGGLLAVIDAALGRLNQAVKLDARAVHLAFLPGYGVIQRGDGGAWRYPLSSLAEGRGLALMEWIRGFDASPTPASAPAPFLSADGETLHLVGPAGAAVARAATEAHGDLNAAAPVAPTQVRVGPIIETVAVDRGWRAERPGRYVASLRLTTPGRHALVMADREGRFHACHLVTVSGGQGRERHARLALETSRSQIKAAGVSTVVFGVAAGSDAGPARGRVELMRLDGGWRGQAEAVRLQDGRYLLEARLPGVGVFVLQPLFPQAAPAYATPLLVETSGATP